MNWLDDPSVNFTVTTFSPLSAVEVVVWVTDLIPTPSSPFSPLSPLAADEEDPEPDESPDSTSSVFDAELSLGSLKDFLGLSLNVSEYVGMFASFSLMVSVSIRSE